MNNKRIVFIVGPTAVGKTEIALKLAKLLDAEIISADSRYLYRGMNIGTAKPSQKELGEVNHHLIDVTDVTENWSLSIFRNHAIKSIKSTIKRGKLPLIVGGTGQYIFSILEGWQIPELAPNFRLRELLEDWENEIGQDAFFSKLEILDPQAARLIDKRNKRRTIRALEVILLTGRLFSSLRKKQPIEYPFKIIGLTRERKLLYQRIDNRIDMMIKEGFIQEVENLIKRGYHFDLPAMSAIGYKEIGLYLSEKNDLDESVRLIKKRTHQFVRRQANWFKKDDPRIMWFDLEVTNEKHIEEYIKSANGWLNE